jgi:hypothetical protein
MPGERYYVLGTGCSLAIKTKRFVGLTGYHSILVGQCPTKMALEVRWLVASRKLEDLQNNK